MVEPNRDSRSLVFARIDIVRAREATPIFVEPTEPHVRGNYERRFGVRTGWIELGVWKLHLLKPRDVAHFGYCIWWLEFSLQSVGGDKTAQLSSISTKFLY